MSEVKKISPVGNIYGWEESQFGEFVLSQDYDALAAEAQALRDERDSQQRVAINAMEELEALRARVVVTPALRDVSASVDPEYRASATGYNLACADMESLNGLTVSEGLLRRISDLFPADMGDDGSGRAGWFPHVRETVAELRALLNQDKENGNG
ncbi:hypothetical protein FHW81_002669 [Pseudomonas sp. RC10-4-2]|uniref:hypothetical protein n=1 Tax=Pseudomonas sp. RC10-4-2 TaxID=2587014 RepID=UPI003D19DB1A